MSDDVAAGHATELESIRATNAALEPPAPPEPDYPPHPAAAAAALGVESSLVEWTSFWNDDGAGPEWLIEPVIPRGRSTVIYSRAGVGKSLLALDLAAGAATGRRILDRPVGDPLRVVYLDLEMTVDDLRERLTDLGYGPDDDLGRLIYYLLPDLPGLDTPAGGDHMQRLMAAHQADLVIVDTTARAVSGEENSADTFRDFHRHTGRLLKADGRTVVRLDHAGKDPDAGQRGSSAKGDDVDLVWLLTQRDDGIRLKAEKRRMSWIPETVDLIRRDTPHLSHDLATHSWPAGTKDVATQLDRLDVALDASSRQAQTALKNAGYGARRTVLLAALKWRRQTPGTTPGTTPPANHPEPLPEPF